MKRFKDRVAVITGAGSGIGRALAERCAHEKMKVVLADISAGDLAQVETTLATGGATVLAVPTDVSNSSDMEALAQKTLDAFGAVHLLFNNAGVVAGTTVWESTLADWEWVLQVNLGGVIHGVRTFVPLMLDQETEGHIVNTASISGLISGPLLGVYKVSKHAVVALSETLYHELNVIGANVKVSVLCPGSVETRIGDAARNRPPAPQKPPTSGPSWPALQAMGEQLSRSIAAGMAPQEIAGQVFTAIEAEQFYILTHPHLTERIRTRMEDILQGRNPTESLEP